MKIFQTILMEKNHIRQFFRSKCQLTESDINNKSHGFSKKTLSTEYSNLKTNTVEFPMSLQLQHTLIRSKEAKEKARWKIPYRIRRGGGDGETEKRRSGNAGQGHRVTT